MRFVHLSDLHIGKKLNGFNLIYDQKYILDQIIMTTETHKVDAVIIAGDVYDSPMPSSEGVMLLDYFLTELLRLNKSVFIITGNHDSPERLTFCSDILKAKGLYIAGLFKGQISSVTLNDKYGPINIYMMPFIKPVHVMAYFENTVVKTYNDAVRIVIDSIPLSPEERNVIIAHQFVTKEGAGNIMSDSETRSAGGLDNVDYSVFDGFDYVALGHLHSPQSVGRDTVVYGGSPIKYSISERLQKKSSVIVTLSEKGDISIEKIPLVPLRELRQIKGPLDELVKMDESDDYVSVILTDKIRLLDPYKRLRAVYRNCLSVAYENEAESDDMKNGPLTADNLSDKTYMEIFEDFYFELNNEELDSFSKDYITGMLLESYAHTSASASALDKEDTDETSLY